MIIILNGEKTEITVSDLHSLCISKDYEYDAIATAVNGNFVPRNQRQQIALNPYDEVEILAPLQGG